MQPAATKVDAENIGRNRTSIDESKNAAPNAVEILDSHADTNEKKAIVLRVGSSA